MKCQKFFIWGVVLLIILSVFPYSAAFACGNANHKIIADASAQNSKVFKIPYSQKISEIGAFAVIKQNVALYNQNLNRVPWFLKKFIGDKKVLFTIREYGNSKVYVWAAFENGKIVEFKKMTDISGRNPTVTVNTDMETVRSILESHFPIKVFNNALNKGKIEIDGYDGASRVILVKAMKCGLVDDLLKEVNINKLNM